MEIGRQQVGQGIVTDSTRALAPYGRVRGARIGGEGREEDVLQRLIGVTVGAVVTFLVLWFYDLTKFTDAIPAYAIAAVVGAFFWPVVIGWWLARRAKERREDEIQKEVQRQIAEGQQKNG